jgi:hypothetical protein
MSTAYVRGSRRLERRGWAVGWRLLVLLSAMMIATAGLASVATAGAPEGTTSSGADITCESEPDFLGIFVPQEEGNHAVPEIFIEFRRADSFIFGGTDDFSFDGTSLSAEVEMFAEGFGGEPEPVGVAIISATITPVGESETFKDRFRDGNRWVEISETFQEAATAGSAVLDGFFDIDLSECEGNTFVQEFWSTNPNSFVGRFDGRFLGCELAVPDGFGFVSADSFDEGTFLYMSIESEDGSLFGFTEDATFTDTELSGVVDLFDEGKGEGEGEPVARAIVEATLESSGFIANEIIFQDGRVKNRVETFDVTGSVAVNGDVFEMIDCNAESFTEQVNIHNANGPKPTGPAPGNDTPEGAESLEARGTTNAQNKGTASAPEVACTFSFDDHEDGEDGHEPEEFPLPIGKTLWYSFVGTGGPITIDSAGSNFDTILGVYDADLNQIVCVDDVAQEGGGFSLQAAATVETVVGAIYLVQVGGFGFFPDPEFPSEPEFGRIRLNTS